MGHFRLCWLGWHSGRLPLSAESRPSRRWGSLALRSVKGGGIRLRKSRGLAFAPLAQVSERHRRPNTIRAITIRGNPQFRDGRVLALVL